MRDSATAPVEVAPVAFIDLQAQRARIGARMDAAIARVLAHGGFIMGPEVAEVERKLAAQCGAKHVITCSSGTTALVSGQESYDLSRAVTFAISATAPEGVSATGYGASVIAGNYTEVLTGLRKDSVTVTGTFTLRRVSEIGTLTQ